MNKNEADSMIDVIYRCKHCSVEGGNAEDLRQHVRMAHIPEGPLLNPNQEILPNKDETMDNDAANFPINILIETCEEDKLAETFGKSHRLSNAIESVEFKQMNTDFQMNKSVVKENIQFECNHCCKKFQKKNGLVAHQKSCARKTRQCSMCEKNFRDIKELERHEKSHYESSMFKCLVCDYTSFQWGQVKIHMEIHNDPNSNQCKDCGALFASTTALKSHWRFHHLGGKHLCDECGFETTSRYNLFQHRMKCHLSAYSCMHCHHACDNQIDLDEHMKLRHQSGLMCKHCSPSSQHKNYDELIAHMSEEHAGKKCYVCDKCNYVAKLRHQLEKHYLMHTGERPLKCQIKDCEYRTRDRTNFKQHMITKHGKPGDLVCRQCQYVTSSQNEWDVHMAMHHMKVFKCDKCPFKTRASACLRRHRLAKHVSHAEMRFPCPHCSYRTNFRDCINKHLLTHVLRSSRHKCTFCKEIFSSREELKLHLSQSHKQNAKQVRFCDICPYTCKRDQVLKQHVLTHSDSKNHTCKLCEYSSRTLAALRGHFSRKHPNAKVEEADASGADNFPTSSLVESQDVQVNDCTPSRSILKGGIVDGVETSTPQKSGSSLSETIQSGISSANFQTGYFANSDGLSMLSEAVCADAESLNVPQS